MKNIIKKYCYFMFIFILFISSTTSFAHSGRTDSNGGHHDYKNKSGLGDYHYHHGYGPHLHPGGVCPYGGDSVNSNDFATPSISISNQPSELYIGDTSGFTYTIQNSSNDTITVRSSDEDVIKVNNDNTLTAVKEGTATITVSMSGAKQNFTVAVKPISVSSIKIDNAPTEIQLEKTQQLEAKVLPENATNKNITWTSQDPNIIEVSEEGIISGNGVGTTVITCTANNGVKVDLPLNVYEVFPERIETDVEELELECKDSELIKVKIFPGDANNKNYKIQIKDESIASVVNNHTVEAKNDGITEIEIVTDNGITKKIPLKVYHIPVDSVEINDNIKYLPFPFSKNTVHGQTDLDIDAIISPKNATFDELEWESSNNNIVSVTYNEFVIKGSGNVVLTVNAHDGVSASIELQVIDLNTTILLIGGCIFLGCICVILIISVKRHK
ncbi:MAG: Ig domain-containing protein [Dorea sp.]|nr:Ig domain-containing protein [Dorea sp.]